MVELGRHLKRPARWPLAAAALLLLGCAVALPAAGESQAVLQALQGGGPQSKFPPPDEVFHLEATAAGPRAIRLHWDIRKGFYLYRSRLKVTATDATSLGPLALPPGQVKMDPYFGREIIYRLSLLATVPVVRNTATGPLAVPLSVTYQGCADAGLCYPPITKKITVELPPGAAAAGSSGGSGAHAAASGAASTRAAAPAFVPQQSRFASLARSGSLLAMIGWFYLAGLALAFTPCCLPTVPILSGIIVGQGRPITTARSFALSLAYVLGMALTYTAAGAAFAAAGGEVQAAFQRPWIIVSFAALFVAMGLSMLGLFGLQMPSAIQTRLAMLSNRQSAGTLGGVAVMGALSALIVTTCVGPALVGALAVISRTGEVARGAAALFAMSIGMGTPLLAVGASAGRLMPKAGPWMQTIKRLFGALMLAVAVWMLGRLLPARMELALWAVPALTAAAVLLGTRPSPSRAWAVRIAGVVLGGYALVLLTGAALGGTDPLAPLPELERTQPALRFVPVHSVAELDHDVALARREGRPVMLDFYADWCTSCKEMEATTFLDPAVRTALAGSLLLRADVTSNDADDQALLRHFDVYGPPTIAFYDRDGRERARYRVVGYMDGPKFASRIRAAFGAPPAS
jgi:thiol:disulfide interchange protein DsbD